MTSPNDSRRILLVDDDPINRRVGSRMLSKLGHQADAAKDVQEAIQLIGKTAYDIVFTDIQMPDISGLDAVKLYRDADHAEPRSRELPLRLIALSADDSERHRQEYLAAGMDDMIGKPVRSEALRAIIEKWYPPLE